MIKLRIIIIVLNIRIVFLFFCLKLYGNDFVRRKKI